MSTPKVQIMHENSTEVLTGGDLLARGGRVLRNGEVVRDCDYAVVGGFGNTATPVPLEWVGKRIFVGLPQPAVFRMPNN